VETAAAAAAEAGLVVVDGDVAMTGAERSGGVTLMVCCSVFLILRDGRGPLGDGTI